METFDAGQSPFQEAIDTQRFFPGAGRREVLDKLKSAIDESVTLLTLTGEEGCGKTMVCRMIEKELPDGYVPIFFSQTVDSFEDVTRVIAQTMLHVDQISRGHSLRKFDVNTLASGKSALEFIR